MPLKIPSKLESQAGRHGIKLRPIKIGSVVSCFCYGEDGELLFDGQAYDSDELRDFFDGLEVER